MQDSWQRWPSTIQTKPNRQRESRPARPFARISPYFLDAAASTSGKKRQRRSSLRLPGHSFREGKKTVRQWPGRSSSLATKCSDANPVSRILSLARTSQATWAAGRSQGSLLVVSSPRVDGTPSRRGSRTPRIHGYAARSARSGDRLGLWVPGRPTDAQVSVGGLAA